MYTTLGQPYDINAELALKSKSIRRLSRKSISQIALYLSKQRIITLDEAEVKLANNNLVYIVNSGGQPSASAAARLMAAKSAKSGRKVILCDTTGQLEKEINKKQPVNKSESTMVMLSDNLSVMTEAEGDPLFTSTNFKLKIKELLDEFDQIFLCTSNRNAQLGLMALLDFTPALVVISGMRKQKIRHQKHYSKTACRPIIL